MRSACSSATCSTSRLFIGHDLRPASARTRGRARRRPALRRQRHRGRVLAGDLITLFVFWELLAVSSTFLIWSPQDRTRRYRAGMRYLLVQVGSGVILLAGIVLNAHETGSIAFDAAHLGLNGQRQRS